MHSDDTDVTGIPAGGDIRGETASQRVLMGQGVFYVFSGVWPILSLRTFEAVTGPKTDGWLVKTVGGLIASVGATLVRGARRRDVASETIFLGASSAGVLGFASLWFAMRGRISKIYLLDAAVEFGIVAAHVRARRASASIASSVPTQAAA